MPLFVLIGCHFIAYGDSGAWVVHDGKLCGHVIGGKGHLPWAYMVPIHQIMREIKLAFGTDNICLPKSVNEYPKRTMRQEPNSEADIDTYNSEKFPTIPFPQAPSVQRVDDQNEKVMDSGASSAQIHLQAPDYPAPRPPVNSYRTILSKLKEESRRFSTVPPPNPLIIAHEGGSVDEIHAISARADTPPGSQDPESWVPNVYKEPKSSGLQHTVSSTGSQHAPPANAVDNTNPALDPESWVPTAQNEPGSSTFQSIMPLIRLSSRVLWEVRLLEWFVLVLVIGLFVGLPVGLVNSSAGRGLSKNSKIGIEMGAGSGGFLLLVSMLLFYRIRANRDRMVPVRQRPTYRPRRKHWTRIRSITPSAYKPMIGLLVLLGFILGLVLGLNHTKLSTQSKTSIGVGVGAGVPGVLGGILFIYKAKRDGNRDVRLLIHLRQSHIEA